MFDLCVCLVMGAVAACESTSTDSAVFSQCSTTEEQTQTLSPHCPPPTCKSAAVYLVQLSLLTFVSWPFLLHPTSVLQKQIHPTSKKTLLTYILALNTLHINEPKWKIWPLLFPPTYCTSSPLPSCAAIYWHPGLQATVSNVHITVCLEANFLQSQLDILQNKQC